MVRLVILTVYINVQVLFRLNKYATKHIGSRTNVQATIGGMYRQMRMGGVYRREGKKIEAKDTRTLRSNDKTYLLYYQSGNSENPHLKLMSTRLVHSTVMLIKMPRFSVGKLLLHHYKSNLAHIANFDSLVILSWWTRCLAFSSYVNMIGSVAKERHRFKFVQNRSKVFW